MQQKTGSFNFPWKFQDKHGTGTASYRFDGDDFTVVLRSIRDSNGDSMSVDDVMGDQLKKIAYDFIREENE